MILANCPFSLEHLAMEEVDVEVKRPHVKLIGFRWSIFSFHTTQKTILPNDEQSPKGLSYSNIHVYSLNKGLLPTRTDQCMSSQSKKPL